MSVFTFFVTPAITLLLFAVGTLPYALWASRRKPSRPARWAAIGSAAAIAAYGAATVYGLAFTNPLAVCGDETSNGLYADAEGDSLLTSVSVDSFPPSITCHWSGGHSTDAVWFWTLPLLYAGLACAVGCVAVLLIKRMRRL
ncbi:hypothetical protein CG723_41165 [Streptomyces sp. CB01635]|uniref:hypothetical protein n=1 Tax=unclassified Streptomyces TaxID=2593676 RepID=UPI000C277693|nr:hypothetical protein [Streptomyces sp. CB01635]PJN06020.1 hypothetical protein CG723_41165 [Streptomyces sp. CB01635]